MRRAWAALAVVFVSAATPAAWAQARDPAAAEALFADAKAAAQAGDFKTACPKLAESMRLDPQPGTILNLADCEEKIGQLAHAWQHWREALERLPPADERRTFASQREAAIAPRVPKLVVALAEGSVAGASVLRDGVELGPASLGVPLPVDPGAHELVVRAPGRKEARRSVRVAEGETQRIVVEPGAADTDAKSGSSAAGNAEGVAGDAKPAGASGGTARTAGFVALGAGVVGIGVAAVTGVMVLGKNDTVEQDCPGAVCTTTEGYDAAQSGSTLLVVNAVGWGVGIAGVGLGLVLILTSGGDSAPRTAIAPTALPGGGGVTLRRSF